VRTAVTDSLHLRGTLPNSPALLGHHSLVSGSFSPNDQARSARFSRLRNAPTYLGMHKNRLTWEVRPQITAIPIGRQGVAFDRFNLDATGVARPAPKR
jgi:hypothetical protein